MPTFIDESGDTGRNPDPANCHFRLAAVWIPSHDVAESFRECVRRARVRLGLRRDYEFKFSKTWSHPEYRAAFFGAAMEHEFRFAVSSLDKRCEQWRTAGKGEFHWASAVYLASSLRTTYVSAQAALATTGSRSPLKDLVVVDDNKDADFLDAVKVAFRGLGSACEPKQFLIGKVRFRGSEPDELVQLVDMVCGAYGAHEDGDSTWYQMIATRDVGTAPPRQGC
ncbi:hypothetical protein GobsT_21210 [Gemmata obscuriglobus]|uniref:DUF3800 domain-containing protein n=1 Tax=Gemmata obscuriglobus TaxID=114 RepID=A0A2Z3H3V7_9BACT|nr:DUF3800 domain-containing protein [Gemmata obscuriglobus]AWM39541.1 hypothetical protein C1280_22790 [Gemmata obscuriglobus]QEG27367.1 hypothetical protein GobsT_21210 [Gemmata obscuriglobus]VTS04249.1 Uncharacterized protein OS=Leptospirillum ferrooxidans (strain C2-3) GN=LFE_0536 PE=4 SV=1: DUF3800 [Gemmata obscuriglobus UQM 2246]